MRQGLSNSPATFNRCVKNLLRSVRDVAPSNFNEVFFHNRAMDGQKDVRVHQLHVQKIFTLKREHKLYANLKKRVFAAGQMPQLKCIVCKHGVMPDPKNIKEITNWPVPADVKDFKASLD